VGTPGYHIPSRFIVNSFSKRESPDAAVFDDPKLAHAPIHLATDTYWNAVIDTNATGTFNCMRAELRAIVKQNRGAAIVNIASVGGIVGLAGNCAYVASKHAVNGLTSNAAIDYAPHGIRVNSVCPAYTTTPMTDTLEKKLKKPDVHKPAPTAYAKSASLIQVSNPSKPPATVWEQAAVILFLLSEDASNITGACIPVDGGWTAF
jgi:NAD(P)-dependent dehydrogenase (short-subunit alcohol dehydrogenase family)